MATAFKSLDTPISFSPKPSPNIRVAFSAGPAALAVREKTAETPQAESTLEEIEIRSLANALIVAAADELSPPMYAAFLRWGEAAARFSTRYETDEEADSRCEADAAAAAAIAALPSTNIQDLLFKSYLCFWLPVTAHLSARSRPSTPPSSRSPETAFCNRWPRIWAASRPCRR